MSHSFLKTRTARYFINKYNRASLLEAIEAAARKERELLLPGMSNFFKLPVDVEGIAKRKGITFVGPLSEEDRRDAVMLASGRTYSMMSSNKTPQRDRFTLAHEIGHTLFLNGRKHQIGVLSKEEIDSEEYICNKFAETLLIPQEFAAIFVSNLAFDSPWAILTAFENACRKLRVSLPALISRVGRVKTAPRSSFILLCLRHLANKYTGEAPCLRVSICSPLGDLRHMRTWANKSATGLNLLSADELFTQWRSNLSEVGESIGGRFTLEERCIVPASKETLKWIEEKIQLSICRAGKWYNEMVPTLTMSCLYTRRGWKESESYIISIVRLQNGDSEIRNNLYPRVKKR